MAPTKAGVAPVASVTANEFVGKVFKIPRGSLRSLSDSSPVLVRVVTIFKFCTPSTVDGLETFRERLGSAATKTAEATSAIKVERRVLENMLDRVIQMGVE